MTTHNRQSSEVLPEENRCIFAFEESLVLSYCSSEIAVFLFLYFIISFQAKKVVIGGQNNTDILMAKN